MKPEDPPPGFDWDMWLRAARVPPYQYNIAPLQLPLVEDYSSQMGNGGVH